MRFTSYNHHLAAKQSRPGFAPLILMLLCGLSLSLPAQSRIDSLETRLTGSRGSERLAVLVDLVEALHRESPERAIAYGREASPLFAANNEPALERRFWYWKGYAHRNVGEYDSVLIHASRLQTLAKAAGDTKGTADAAYLMGLGHISLGAYPEAQETLILALEGYELLADKAGLANTLNNIGVIHRHQGNYDEALSFFTRSLTIRERLADRAGMATTLNFIGRTHFEQGNYDEALSLHTRARAIFEETGDMYGTAATLNDIARIYYVQGDYEEALTFFTRTLPIYEKIGRKQSISIALNNIGGIHFRQGNYDEALSFFSRSLAIREELGSKRGVASVLGNIGNIHMNQGNYDEALSFFKRSLAIHEEIGDKRGIGRALNNIGRIHKDRGDYDESLLYFTRSLTICEETGNMRGLVASLTNIGVIYSKLGSYDEALSFHTRALAIGEKLGAKYSISLSLTNIGTIYSSQGNYDEALSFHTRALAIREEMGDKDGIASDLNNVGAAYKNLGKYDRALECYTRALAIDEEIGDKGGIATTLTNIGEIHRAEGEFAEALNYTGRALALADSLGYLEKVRDIHEKRSRIFEEAGQFEQALNAYRAYRAIQDSLFTSESQSVIAELQQQYKTKEQQQRIQLLQRDQQIQRLWLFALIGGVLLLAAIAFLAYNRYRLKNRAHNEIAAKNEQLAEQAEQLQELDSLKSRFFANISHEFRTPLTLILGPVEQMIEMAHESKFTEKLNTVERNTHRLLRLINELLDLAKLESGKMALHTRLGNIAEFLKGIVAAFSSMADSRNINLQFTTSGSRSLPPLYFDHNKMEKIIANILANAFKFTPNGGTIILDLGLRPAPSGISDLKAKTSEIGNRKSPKGEAEISGSEKVSGYAEIRISDTGAGIPENDLPYIFDRFYQARDESGTAADRIGTGIGMALTRELVGLHQGTISVESEVDKGTAFIIQLPVGKAHLRPEQISEPSISEVEFQPVPVGNSALEMPARHSTSRSKKSQISEGAGRNPKSPKEEAEIILLLEDNPDMRAYIREELLKEYQLMEAANGYEGFEKAVEIIPDLIVSDVMMPEMNGFQLCEKLKTDERTSHVPVILLTAKAGEESKIEGLETGADDYLTKPFSFRELHVRVKNLIEQRRKLRERYSDQTQFKPSEVAITSVDRKFMEKALATVEKFIEDESFGVDNLAAESGLSRSQLSRKFRALIDQSPAQFILAIRLQRAKDLIRQNAGTIAEIAYMTGFNTPNYFAKCFRKQYGLSPSAHIEQLKSG